MGEKSRPGWNIEFCMKNCANERVKCDECIRFSYYLPIEEEQDAEVKTSDRE